MIDTLLPSEQGTLEQSQNHQKNKVEQELQKTIALANQSKKEKAMAEQKKKTNRGKAKKEVEEEEEEEEEGEDKEEKEVVGYDKEVVSLILILLCMTFLFANSSSNLHWKIVEHCENLDTLPSFSWSKAVSAYINESLITKAKAKKGGEASIGVVLGCTVLISVNIVEGWLEYIRPQAQVFLETRKIPKLVKQKQKPPTLVLEDMSPNEELTLNWTLQSPYQFPFEDDTKCAQQSSSSLDCGMFVMFYKDKIAQGQPIPKSVDKNFMNEYRAQYILKLQHHKNCLINRL
ncbi:hypothetical protein ACE6H2_015339 [Prunus campanulata]